MKNKKKFGQTTVGRILKGAVGLINPTLGKIVEGGTTVEEVIAEIKESQVPVEDKIRAQEMILEAYEAEVADRASARSREIAALNAGSNDILFKTVGWGITLSFILIVLYAIGIVPPLEDIDKDYLMFASGAVTAAFTQVIGYYFGSSMGSKHKDQMIHGKS